MSGAGGTDGFNGTKNNGTDCGYNGVGWGKGAFSLHFQLLTSNRFTAGAGGSGRFASYPCLAGGGGGVLLNGSGPTAEAGDLVASGFGGSGFGAGGGAGDFLFANSFSRCYAGRKGVDKLVYVECNSEAAFVPFS